MYYKVVKSRNGKYFSAVVDDLNYTIEYTPNTPVKPKNGGIFVFNNLLSAKEFVKREEYNGKLVIFKCKVKNPRPLNYRASRLENYCFDMFWNKYNFLRKKHKSTKSMGNMCSPLSPIVSTPANTYIVSEITLIEEV